MASTKQQTNSSKSKKQEDWIAYAMVLGMAVLINAVGPWAKENLDLGLPAEEKPFSTFESFYPFYLSQHEDQTCRRLHFVGTSIVILFSLVDYKIGISLLPAGLLGYGLAPFLMDVPHGFFEMAVMFLSFLLCVYATTGSVNKGVICLLIGYAFAWVGHFYFEMNKPATFIYPTYSLFGDFKMWYEIATGAKAF